MRGAMIEQGETRDLIQRILDGERTAFDSLCRAQRDPVLATIRRMIGRAARPHIDPEDVMQDVLTTAWASLGEFRWQGPGSFRRWIEGIARHRVLHLSRCELRRAELLRLYRPESGDVSPSRGVRRRERFERLRDAVDGLRPEYRHVLQLARIEGRSIREIAAAIGKTESAVKNLLLRAMRVLREAVPETESLTLPKDCRIGEHPDGHDAKSEDGSDDDGV